MKEHNEITRGLTTFGKVNDQSALRSRNDAVNLGSGLPSVVPDRGSEIAYLGKRKRADLEAYDDGNSKLQEFLEVMQPPSKSRIWANEDAIATKTLISHAPSSGLQVINEGKNDKDYENVPRQPTKPRMREEISGNSPRNSISSSTAEVSTNMIPILDEILKPPVRAPPPPSDEDWLRSRTSRLLDLVEDDETLVSKIELARDEEKEAERAVTSESSTSKKIKDQGVQEDEETTGGSSKPMNPWSDADDTSDTSGRLFVRNLPYTATEEDLKRHFESNGHTFITEVSLAETCQV